MENLQHASALWENALPSLRSWEVSETHAVTTCHNEHSYMLDGGTWKVETLLLVGSFVEMSLFRAQDFAEIDFFISFFQFLIISNPFFDLCIDFIHFDWRLRILQTFRKMRDSECVYRGITTNKKTQTQKQAKKTNINKIK